MMLNQFIVVIEDWIKCFGLCLKNIAKLAASKLKNVEPLKKNERCEKKIIENDTNHRDHHHISVNSHCTPWNLNYKNSFVILVDFHNLSGYDNHFIISDFFYVFDNETNHFIDSFRLWGSSLDFLASLHEQNFFSILRKLRKGILWLFTFNWKI